MSQKTFVFTIFMLFSFLFLMPKNVWAGDLSELDYRELQLYHYLKQKKSPLTPYSKDFLRAADYWDINWKLLPAIAGLESNFGKRLLAGSYNSYGWGGGYYYFESWRDSIYHVSEKLRSNYYQNGLKTAYEISSVYAPPNSHWGNQVAALMSNI